MFNLSFLQALKSKTVWAIAVAVGLQVVNSVSADPASFVAALHLAPEWANLVSAALGVVAIYGRVKPTQGIPGKDPAAKANV